MIRTPTVSTPPPGLIRKFRYYSNKYGSVSSAARYLGRHSAKFWNIFGVWFSRNQILRWLNSPDPKILNLGGGSHCMSEVLTVDIDARADAYVNVCEPLPFPNRSVDAIFCEEVIEHVPVPEGRKLLAECLRILKPGGTLRLTTPDLCWFARRVLENPHETFEINDIFYLHGHRHIYTPDELERECRATGFINPTRSSYKQPDSLLGWLDSHADRFQHPPEMSQYLEVTAPGEQHSLPQAQAGSAGP